MKNSILVLISAVFATLPVHAAKVGGLESGATYQVSIDGHDGNTVAAGLDGALAFGFPTSSQRVEIVFLASAPTATPSYTPTTPPPTQTPTPVEPDPTETPKPTTDVTDQPTVVPTSTSTSPPEPTATPTSTSLTQAPTSTPSPTPTPTLRVKGKKGVIVGKYDKKGKRHTFDVLDNQGKGLHTETSILDGAVSTGVMVLADLDGDESMEVAAAAFISENELAVEYWSLSGEPIQSGVRGDYELGSNLNLLACNLDGLPGDEVVLFGKKDGEIHTTILDHGGKSLQPFDNLAVGLAQIEASFVADLDGDGDEEIVFLGRRNHLSVDLVVVDAGATSEPLPVLGAGYTDGVNGFPIDLDGDGDFEIGVSARNSSIESSRILVLDGFGNILLKANVLPGKFEAKSLLASGDIDSDGFDEILATGKLASTGENIVQIIDDDGSQMLALPVLDSAFDSPSHIQTVDTDEDSFIELVVGGRDRVTGLAAFQVYEGDGKLAGGGTALEEGTDESPLFEPLGIETAEGDSILIHGRLASGQYCIELRNTRTGALEFVQIMPEPPMQVLVGEL